MTFKKELIDNEIDYSLGLSENFTLLKNKGLVLQRFPSVYHTFYTKGKGDHMEMAFSEEDADEKLHGLWNHYGGINDLKELIGPQIKNSNIIDAGACTGWFSHLFEHLGAKEVDAIDVDNNTERYTIYNLLKGKYNFIHWNIYQLKNLNKKYDYVWTQDVFCHLEHPFLAMRNLREVCNKKIFFGIDNTTFTLEDVEVQNRWPDININSFCHYYNNTYTFSYSRDFVKKMFVDCGFKNPELKFSYKATCDTSDDRLIDVWEAEVDENATAFPPHRKLDYVTEEWLGHKYF